MSIQHLNEQLLRAVGVGLALFSEDDLTLRFQNEVFEGWFEDTEDQDDITSFFPKLDVPTMQANVLETGEHVDEIRFRKKRRTVVIAQKVTRAIVGDQGLYVVECQNISRIKELEAMLESYSNMVERNTKELEREKEQVEKLLLNMMPRAAYDEYKTFGIVSPKKYDDVSVLFLEFSNFVETMDALQASTFVGELNDLYTAFDRIGEQFGCERIKTIGDRYVCISGLQDGVEDHREAVSKTAVRFMQYLERRNQHADMKWNARIGLGGGAVIGSVVGAQNYIYDVFGVAIQNATLANAKAGPDEIVAHSSFQANNIVNINTSVFEDNFLKVTQAAL